MHGIFVAVRFTLHCREFCTSNRGGTSTISRGYAKEKNINTSKGPLKGPLKKISFKFLKTENEGRLTHLS